jgi:CheY-like chemotaxis protein
MEIFYGEGRILLVDDEVEGAKVVAQLLQRLGYEVIIAGNGREALQVFGEGGKRLDLLITDQSMPQMSGIELAAAIKSIQPGMPVILCSGYGSLEGEMAGIDKVLVKPLGLRGLSRVVKELLTGSRDS